MSGNDGLPDAGRDLDARIAERIFGWSFNPVLHRDALLPHYSTSIADAWEVHTTILDRLFSVRQHYFDALKKAAAPAAWPDVLVLLRHTMPLEICRAALEADAQ